METGNLEEFRQDFPGIYWEGAGDGDFVILDLRTPDEFTDQHIEKIRCTALQQSIKN